jgi:hypothetical protein
VRVGEPSRWRRQRKTRLVNTGHICIENRDRLVECNSLEAVDGVARVGCDSRSWARRVAALFVASVSVRDPGPKIIKTDVANSRGNAGEI